MPDPLRGNLFTDLPSALPEELSDVLASTTNVRIERIVSTGHSSREGFWCDEVENKWAVVLKS